MLLPISTERIINDQTSSVLAPKTLKNEILKHIVLAKILFPTIENMVSIKIYHLLTLSHCVIILLKRFFTVVTTKGQWTDSIVIVNKRNSNLQNCLQILIVKFLCAGQSGIYQHLPQLLTDLTHSYMQWTFLPRMDFYIKTEIWNGCIPRKCLEFFCQRHLQYASKLTLDYRSRGTWEKTGGKKI